MTPVGQVAHRVGETRQAIELPARQVLETHLKRGMANHPLFIAKDGAAQLIDDNASRY